MILVTGGAGFIGSNLVHGLNARAHSDVLVVDNLERGEKFRNLVGTKIADYIDKDDFAELLDREDGLLDRIEVVFHQGACSDTLTSDGRFMMRNNYGYSKKLLAFAHERRVPMIYASSAAVYGKGRRFVEQPSCEAPVNVYAYSKLLFDEHVRRTPAHRPVVGLRYFNVYGPRETHKGSMASVAFHLHRQLRGGGGVRLFRGCDGYADGEQRRDFVHVDDVVAVNLWFLDHPEHSGIFNVGTGQSRSFNDVAAAVVRFFGRGEVEYVPFPESLGASYQSFTEADLTRLRGVGCAVPFRPLDEGVAQYLAALAEPSPWAPR